MSKRPKEGDPGEATPGDHSVLARYGYNLAPEDPFGGWDRDRDRELDNRRRARAYAGGCVADLIPLIRYTIASSKTSVDREDPFAGPKAMLPIYSVYEFMDEIERQRLEISRLERLLAAPDGRADNDG